MSDIKVPRRVGLYHFDLDGVACDILISKMYTFEKKFKCGYAKMKKYIVDGALSGYDTAIIADISLTYGQFQQMAAEYGKNFLYIDHHGPSVEMVRGLKNNESPCFVNTEYSGAGITFQTFHKRLMNIPGIMDFITSVDAYDCWRWKTHPDNFGIGYDLNTLFWQYGYNDFYSRFYDDMSIKWQSHEQKWISNHAKARDNAIINADKTPFGKNSLIVIDTPESYVNDFGLQFPEIDIFYLLYTTIQGNLSLSVRTTKKDIDVGGALKQAKMGNPYINTAGGHPEAGGMDFYGEMELDLILDIIETINNTLEGNPVIVPF